MPIECRKCREIKPESEFHRNARAESGVVTRCKACTSAWRKEEYARNIQKHSGRAASRKSAKQAAVVQHMMEHPCEDCGERDIRVLEFHHRDPGEKEFSVAMAVARVGMADLVAEIAKCRVLCANCHRRLHSVEYGSYRAKAWAAMAA